MVQERSSRPSPFRQGLSLECSLTGPSALNLYDAPCLQKRHERSQTVNIVSVLTVPVPVLSNYKIKYISNSYILIFTPCPCVYYVDTPDNTNAQHANSISECVYGVSMQYAYTHMGYMEEYYLVYLRSTRMDME